MGGFGVVFLLLLTLAALSFTQMQTIASVNASQERVRKQQLEPLFVAREALGQTGLAARNAFIVRNESEVKRELDILDRQKTIYLDAVTAMAPVLAGNPEFDKVRQGLLAMADELKRPRQYVDAGKIDAFGAFLVSECSPLRRQIVADMDKLVDSIETSVDRQRQQMTISLERSEMLIVSVSAAAILLGIVIAWLITRDLLRQLGGEPAEVSAITGRIAAGDLTTHIATRDGDNASIMHAVKDMRDNLQRIVTDVRSGTESIATVSAEIASGNMDLSSRTEQQASSLEETAASIEELTSTVKQNAANAQQANQLASDANSNAVKGGEVVAQVIDTMGSIDESAKRIVDIISVIDSIAFQTNILSLNAAVEAARAGEQGKGFAVVASEVRSLAQRSAAAAKEIKALIGDSVDKVNMGSKLVAEAGATMDDIVTSVKRVSDIMAEISHASVEQRGGIEQVNQAITQMDQVTQQNAALVEQAAAAADSLKEQAQSLAQQVGIFKVERAAQAAALPRMQPPAAPPRMSPVALPARPVSARKTLSRPASAQVSQTDGWEEF